MLALLALALFPVAAYAGESGESVYEPEVPTIHSEGVKEKPKSTSSGHKSTSPNNPPAEGSATGGTETGESSGEAEMETAPESEGNGHKKEGGAGGPSGGGNGNPPNSGGEGGKSSTGGKVGVGESKELESGGTQSGKQVSSSSGSSPVVPILIAVIVLAAISIGVVLYRQRKSGQGPDGRDSVSSSNAS